MSTEIRDEVRRVIAEEFGEPVANLTDAKKFVDDLFGDSLDELSLICALEDEFKIEIPDEDAHRLQTVGDVCAYVERKALEVVTR